MSEKEVVKSGEVVVPTPPIIPTPLPPNPDPRPINPDPRPINPNPRPINPTPTPKDKILEVLKSLNLIKNDIVLEKIKKYLVGKPKNDATRDKVAEIIYYANKIDFSHALDLANKIMDSHYGTKDRR